MNINWQDKRVQAAVGIFVIVLAVKWLASDGLLYAASVYSGDITRETVDAEGFTTSVPVTFGWSTILPLVFDALLALVVAVGAWVINLGEFLVGKFSKQNITPQARLPPSDTVVTDDDSIRKLAISLADAAQRNDSEALEANRVKLRMPQAIDELREAFSAKDGERARRLFDECLELIDMGAKKKVARNG